MKLMAERRTRLSVAVRLVHGAEPRAPLLDGLQLSLAGASGEPLTHREGYWLFLDVPPGRQMLSWTSSHHQDGQLGVLVDPALPRTPVVDLPLLPAAPVAFGKASLASLARGRTGRTYREALALQGGKPPFRYTATGLPPGLVMRQAGGTIEGVPTRRGNFQVALTVTDVNGTQDRQTCRLSVTA